MANNGTSENTAPKKKDDYRERYRRISNSDEFLKIYGDKTLGDIQEVDQ